MAGDGAEGVVPEWEIFGVSLSEIDLGVALPGVGEHGRREIEAGHLRAALRGRRGQRARSAGGVEQPYAGANARRVQHGLVRLRGEAAEQIVIVDRGPLPSGVLEILEGLGVERSVRAHGGSPFKKGNPVPAVPRQRAGP